MNVFDTIDEMKSEFLSQTWQHATNIYMGKNEVNTLLHDVERYGVLLTDGSEISAPTVSGLKIHKTDDETHLALSVAI